jgi:hypothetical protein
MAKEGNSVLLLDIGRISDSAQKRMTATLHVFHTKGS